MSPQPDALDPSASAERELRVLGQLLGGDTSTQGWYEQRVLVEPTTGLPTLQLMLVRIERELSTRSQVALMTLHVSPTVRIEHLFGWQTFDDISRSIAEVLGEVKQECLREQDFLAEISASGTSFVLVLSGPRYGAPLTYDTLAAMRERLRGELAARIGARFPAEVAHHFDCSIGCVIVNADHAVPLNRLILRGLDAAYDDAHGERDQELERRRAVLQDIIERKRITTVFQPIADLQAERVLGYEACARGPAGEFENPALLFELAGRCGLVWQLDRLCRDMAGAQLGQLEPGQLLFLNLDAESIFDPDLGWRAAVEGFGGRVVLELTERAAIRDFRMFQRVLAQVRDLGMQFAIDDVGSAYSGLRLIAESKPNYIKLDMAITRGLYLDEIRRELVRMLLHLGERIGSALIVEGVETAEELRALREIGVRYIQGFLFDTPRPRLSSPGMQGLMGMIDGIDAG